MGDLQPQTVLVVDDARLTAVALAGLLAGAGHACEIVADGALALERVAAEPKVDLVLLDLQLARPDGLQVLRSLRAGAGRRHLPVIGLIEGEERDLRLCALQLGVDDVVSKPWDAPELLARVSRCLGLRRRIDALVQEAAELHHLSVTDGLTQTHNHRFFQDRLKEEFRRAQRYDDPLALMILDIDHFKEVNDRHGHPAGDQVLKEVAECIRQAVRDTDLLARYGGEEFAVLLPKTHLAGALTVAERVWRGLGALATGPGRSVRVTASLGVSGFPGRQVASAEQLLRTADQALYRAKREGRNKICLFQQVSFFSPAAHTA